MEMLRHAVAHVALEAVARMRERRAASSAGRASPWRRSRPPRSRAPARRRRSPPRSRSRSRCGRGRRRTRAWAAPAAPAPRAPAPTATRAGYCRGRCGRSSRRRPRPRRWRRFSRRASRAPRASSFLESLRPRGMRSGSRITAAATTGPGQRTAAGLVAARHRPDAASSAPRRSRRNVGRRISSTSGRRATFAAWRRCDSSPRSCAPARSSQMRTECPR